MLYGVWGACERCDERRVERRCEMAGGGSWAIPSAAAAVVLAGWLKQAPSASATVRSGLLLRL